MHRILSFSVGVVILLAGCAGTTPPASLAGPSVSVQTQAPSDAAADEGGNLRVVVVDPELAPVAKAQVVVEGADAALFSGDDGVALFEDLSPGPYTVLVAKPGHRSIPERGRGVEVVALETIEVRMTLEPLRVAEASTSYYATVPFRGFSSCSVSSSGTATSPCGRGVTVGGVTINDTNDSSSHRFSIDGIHLSGIVLEATWQPTIGGFAGQMHISLSKLIACTQAGICGPDGQMGGAGGPNPVRYEWPTSPRTNPGESFSADPGAFPLPAYAAVRAFCPTGCTATIVFQQPYNAYATTFYGENPPPGFSALPGS
jgi:hypothetical protein